MRAVFRFSLAMMLMLPMVASAQNQSDPVGYVTYSLPSTTIMLEVEAEQEIFHAGPYAKYAEKYLGIKVPQQNDTVISITQVRMLPLVEADQTRRFSVDVRNRKNASSLLRLTSEGLISFSDAQFTNSLEWRFSHEDASDNTMASVKASELAMLCHNCKKSAAKYNLLADKTPQQKAEEVAQAILKLRTQRMQIVTGDTDATYSGEAMAAAINEITRQEEEYMMLFTGYSEHQNYRMRYEVIPSAEQENQTYAVFGLSKADGLVYPDTVAARQITMQIIPQEMTVPEPPVVEGETKKKVEVLVYYRIPAVCTVKLMDGEKLMLQGRMPVYQLGLESSIPLNVIFK